MRRLLLTFIMVAIAIPSFAFEIPLTNDAKLNVYGSVRMLINYNMLNYNTIDNGVVTTPAVSDTYVRYIMQPDSKFGVDFTMNRIFARAELGYRSTANANVDRIGLRLLYAGIDMGDYGKITVGQMISTSSYALYFSDVFMGDNRLVGYGATTTLIAPAIAYEIKGFEIAVVDMYSTGTMLPDNVSKTGQLLLPRLEAAYTFKFTDAFLKIFAAYANINTTYTGLANPADPTTVQGNGKRSSINAFHAGAFTRAQFGSFGFQVGAFASLNGEVYGAVKQVQGITLQNIKPAYQLNPDDGTPTAKDYAGVKNSLAFGGALALYNQFGNVAIMELAGGVQYLSSDGILDINDTAAPVITFGGYLNSVFLVHPNFRITPQVGFYMRQSDAVNYLGGFALVAGLQFNALF